MGEQHPAEKKVVLEFSPSDMPDLTSVQRDKLRKLLGPRYNPEKDTVRMSSEMYETQAQNKRYLGDIVDSLLAEARVRCTLYRPKCNANSHRILPTLSKMCLSIHDIILSSANCAFQKSGQ
jgi:hypothetical protein